MTKQHFIELANCIKANNRYGKDPFTAEQIDVLANFCKEQNYRFDRHRWLGYIAGECGPSGGAIKTPPKPKAPYQPTTGTRCSCRPGIERDNCPNCEGTGWTIDFKRIRESMQIPGPRP